MLSERRRQRYGRTRGSEPSRAYSTSQRLTALTSPAGLGKVSTGGRFSVPAHVNLLNEFLLALAEGEYERLMVFAPPRHGKSTMVSHFFPSWYLGTFSNKRVILTSYEADYAREWGAKCRDTLEDLGPSVFGVRVRSDSYAAQRWDLEERDEDEDESIWALDNEDEDGSHLGGNLGGGGMRTSGVSGPLTGKGADLLIIDDPIKNTDEARSVTHQAKQLDWIRGTAFPRLEPGGKTVLMMTRWHENDVAGRLLREEGRVEEGGLWTVLELPALAIEHPKYRDPLGRAPGEALWPERFPRKILLDRLQSLQPFWFAAEYQQNPVPEGGSVFKRQWLRRYYENVEGHELFFYLDGPEEIGGARRFAEGQCWRFATVDLATSLATTADYTVVGIWIVTPDGDLLLEKIYRDRVAGPDQIPLLIHAQKTHHLSLMGIESVGYQLSMVQDAVRNGLPAVELKPGREHVEDRAIPAAVKMSQGRFYMNAAMSGREAFEEEVLQFPSAPHDDQVAVLSYAAKMLLEYGVGRRVSTAAEGGSQFNPVLDQPFTG